MKKMLIVLLLAAAMAPAAAAFAQPPRLEAGYQLPPKVIVDILDAPPPPTAVVSPARDVMALLDRVSMPKIADLAEPMLRLAGSPGVKKLPARKRHLVVQLFFCVDEEER